MYRDGLAFVPFALNLTIGGVGIYFLGSRMHRLGKANGYVTPADLVGDYYGGNAVRLLAALTGACMLPYVIMQIKAGGYLAERLFPDVPQSSSSVPNMICSAPESGHFLFLPWLTY